MKKLFLSNNSEFSIDDVLNYVKGEDVALETNPNYQQYINDNHELLLKKVREGMDIYGANTGFGSSSKNRFDLAHSIALQRNLYSYHGCGIGSNISEQESAAILFIRTHCLARGYSGVSYNLLQHLTLMLNHRIYPVIPSIGSVGASGDLTPLSYLAAAVAGERQVYYQGKIWPTIEVYGSLGIKPYTFKPREALAIMNGTSVMTGILVIVMERLQKVVELTCTSTGLLVELLEGRSAAYLQATHLMKKHKGQQKVAEKILGYMENIDERLYNNPDGSIQDRYSLRCTPQVVGVLVDTISWSESWIENEVNSISDNPVFIDDKVLNAGHFFGGHMAQAADSLKAALATTVNLLDRQMAFLMECAEKSLSENLVLRNHLGEQAPLHHGFKAIQITMSAITAELIKQSIPMAIFSRPTETSNQDVVSMGTIAARDLSHMTDLAESVVAILFMAISQGFQVRKDLHIEVPLHNRAHAMLKALENIFPKVVEDRAMDNDILVMRQFLFHEYQYDSN